MTTSARLAVLASCWIFSIIATAEELPAPAPLGKGATKALRQVMPDGSIVYSDKPVKGGKVDETIVVDPTPGPAPLAIDAGKKPAAKPRAEPTPINKVNAIPPAGKRMTPDEAHSEVIRAEMLLEDAQKRQQAGVEPLPGERTANANGGSRLNEAYEHRQQEMAKEVERAKDQLRKAASQRDTLLPVR
jgi:hypothetical protein